MIKNDIKVLYIFINIKINKYNALNALELKPDNKFDLNTLTNASNGHINDLNTGCHYKLIEHYKKLIQNHSANSRTKLFLLDNLIADSRFEEAYEVLDGSKLDLDVIYRLWIKRSKKDLIALRMNMKS